MDRSHQIKGRHASRDHVFQVKALWEKQVHRSLKLPKLEELKRSLDHVRSRGTHGRDSLSLGESNPKTRREFGSSNLEGYVTIDHEL
jgi:hypothetical protein